MPTDDRVKLEQSLTTFDSLLHDARVQLEAALIQQREATASVEQWQTEVDSLTKLLEIWRRRLNPQQSTNGSHPSAEMPRLPFSSVGDGVDVNGEQPKAESKSAWIRDTVYASGNRGITAAEVYKIAKSRGITMHRNYAYTVLKGLAEREKVIKKGVKYFKP